MKKTVSIIFAVIFALTAIFALTSIAFADDGANILNSATTAAADVAPAPETSTAPAANADSIVDSLSKLSDAIDNLPKNDTSTLPNSVKPDDAEVVTNAPGVTAIDEGTSAEASTEAPEVKSTKAAAAVTTYVPNTGSNAAIGVVALLALAGGACAAVVSKKKEG